MCFWLKKTLFSLLLLLLLFFCSRMCITMFLSGPHWGSKQAGGILGSRDLGDLYIRQVEQKPGGRGRGREWATLGVHPLSWLLSNNRLEKVPFVSVPHTPSNRLLLSNQDKGCTPSVAHSLALPLDPALLNLWNMIMVHTSRFLLTGYVPGSHIILQVEYLATTACMVGSM